MEIHRDCDNIFEVKITTDLENQINNSNWRIFGDTENIQKDIKYENKITLIYNSSQN
jgi:hypothetical protein